MVFSSLSFLFIFLPITVIVYIFVDRRFANLWLLAASVFFYYKGDKDHIFLLLVVVMIAYLAGIIISNTKRRLFRNCILIISVATIIGILGYYKYWTFIVSNLNTYFHTGINMVQVALPVGISFFVFQAISYIVDVYRGGRHSIIP